MDLQRVVIMKDDSNKKLHEESAHLACEAAGAIRTVASLTREEDCCDLYSQSLEQVLQKSNRSGIWSNALYGLSQALVFFVIALVFWYGAILVSNRELSTFHFFVGLMVRQLMSESSIAIDPICTEYNLRLNPSW